MHGPTDLEGSLATLPPRTWPCDWCDEEFATAEDLREHLFVGHPRPSPRLYVFGREVGTRCLGLSERLNVSDVQVVGASRALVNGRSASPREVGKRLAEFRAGVCKVVLCSGDDVARHFELDFRVPERTDLIGVEKAFAKLERGLALDRAAIGRFFKDASRFPSAQVYREGIFHYLLGVLSRERWEPIAGETGAQRYMRATKCLSGYRTPLARTICAVAEFHLCNFSQARGHMPGSATGGASSAFLRWLMPSGQGSSAVREHAGSPAVLGRLEDAVMDRLNRRVVQWAVREYPVSSAEADGAEGLLDEGRLDSYDKMKLGILLGEAYRARRQWGDALRVARSLEGRGDTEHWARALRRRALVVEHRRTKGGQKR